MLFFIIKNTGTHFDYNGDFAALPETDNSFTTIPLLCLNFNLYTIDQQPISEVFVFLNLHTVLFDMINSRAAASAVHLTAFNTCSIAIVLKQ